MFDPATDLMIGNRFFDKKISKVLLHTKKMDEIKTVATVTISIFGILSLFFLVKKFRKNNTEKWIHVGYLDEILIHPIKGSKARSVSSAFVGSLGVQSGPYVDRLFMVAEKERSIFKKLFKEKYYEIN